MVNQHTDSSFDRLVAEAMSESFTGWDFSYLNKRWQQHPLPWSYLDQVSRFLPNSQRMLDMGTGGGELLSSISPLPPDCWATEAYAPNITIAQARLEPLGINVVAVEDDAHLPLPDTYFDLVINRHAKFYANEVIRIMVPNGRFITQQVGELNAIDLNDFLCERPVPRKHSYYQQALHYLKAAGLMIVESHEVCVELDFFDIGAVIFYLRAIPWQVRDFTIDRYRSSLFALHNMIISQGKFTTRAHHYYIEAVKGS